MAMWWLERAFFFVSPISNIPMSGSSPLLLHPINLPAPFPRIWAYAKLLVVKTTNSFFGPERVTPPRKNGEKGIWEKIMHFWSRDPTSIPGTNIFLGSAKNAADSHALERNNIRTVINATVDVPNFFEGRSDRIQYLRIPLEDVEGATLPMDELKRAVDVIQESDGNVLVHCMMGASRSAAIVCYYLMATRRWTMEDTYAKLCEWRAAVTMNQAFYDQLIAEDEEEH